MEMDDLTGTPVSCSGVIFRKTGQQHVTRAQKIEPKPVFACARVYVVVLMLMLTPVCAMGGGTQLHFEWDPNPEPDITGYQVFSREPGEDYNYKHPVWKGQENYCSIFVDDEDAVYLFVVRAYDTDGFESDDSNEVVYPDDAEYSPEDEYSNESRYADDPGSSTAGGCFIDTLTRMSE